jgi:hypothetical protein
MGSSRRRGWSHGVDVRRRTTNGPGDRRASEVLLRRICIRYEDGRKVCFIPEAGEEFFSQDDAHRVVGMLHKGSEALEWGLALEGQPGTERVPGEGPYDTGAV